LAYSRDPYVRAFIVGIVNTLRVAVIGIVLATVIGTLIGMRGCRRMALSRLAAIYVELLRDVPLCCTAVLVRVMQGLPAHASAWKPIEGCFFHRGLVLPSGPDRGSKPLGDRRRFGRPDRT